MQNVQRPPDQAEDGKKAADGVLGGWGGWSRTLPMQAGLLRGRQQELPCSQLSDTPGRHLRHLMRSAYALLLAQTQQRCHPAD